MSLQAVVAAPFRQRGREQIGESEFIVALSLDRDWFSPDQATRIVDLAIGRGLLSRDGDELEAEFDPETVEIPAEFAPDESLLRDRSPFEEVLDALVATGMAKQEAVAGINRLQADLDVTIDAAAVVYARREGLTVNEAAVRARAELAGDDG